MEGSQFTGQHGTLAYGPFSFLNPTTRHYRLPPHTSNSQRSQDDLQNKESSNGEENGTEDTAKKRNNETLVGDVERVFKTRDNRKGRHQISISPALHQDPQYLTPPPTNTFRATLHGVLGMFTYFPYWDVSYLVAIIFTIGSIDWCVNAFFVWLPLEMPSSEFPGEIANAGGISAFAGATIFEIGSVLLMIEAVNENRADCFGWAVEEVLEERGLRRLRPEGCHHHHDNKRNLVGKGKAVAGKPPLNVEMTSKDEPDSKSARTWTWWPTWYELKTHYFKEVGFLACSSQMLGATIFWISGFTALPPIYNRLTSTAAQNGAYWLPQVLGGSGFIVSGFLFMVETQKKWYIPAPKVLGWHIGVWNLIGGIGFTLCGALGFAASNSGCVYQGSLATFWGSWCFLIGSVIQWYESLDKHPVNVGESGKTVSDSQPA